MSVEFLTRRSAHYTEIKLIVRRKFDDRVLADHREGTREVADWLIKVAHAAGEDAQMILYAFAKELNLRPVGSVNSSGTKLDLATMNRLADFMRLVASEAARKIEIPHAIAREVPQ